MWMNEARKFMRLILPGVLLAFMTLFLSWIGAPEWTVTTLIGFFGKMDKPSAVFAMVISYLFLSGAVGYILSNIHHSLHWHSPTDENVINHIKSIKLLREKNLIDADRETIDAPRLEALITMSALWFKRLDGDKTIANSLDKIEKFGDLTHSAGTARVAAILSLVISTGIFLTKGKYRPLAAEWHFGWMVVIGFAFILIFWDSYKRLGNISQHLYDQMIEQILQEEKNKDQNNSTKEDSEKRGQICP